MLLVANPKSGICKVKDILLDLLTIFTKAGYTVTVYPTRKSGTTEYLKEHAKNYGVVVCCGGDGTLSEVLRGVCESKSGTPVGYIPMGSTNDFAKSLGISKNPKSAAMSIINGTVMGPVVTPPESKATGRSGAFPFTTSIRASANNSI